MKTRMVTCRVCGERKPASKMSPGRRRCRQCHNAYCRNYLATHPIQKARRQETIRRWQHSAKGRAYIKRKGRAYHRANRARIIARLNAWRAAIDDKVFEIYGAICVCCGETERAFLTVDHVNGNGHADRRRHGGHRQLRFWLSKQPKLPDYQVLCYNCNCGRERNGGICPHKVGERSFTLVAGGK